MPPASISWIVWRRIHAAIFRVQAASMTGARSSGTTNTVRRIPRIRTTARSSYSARSMSGIDTDRIRARAER